MTWPNLRAADGNRSGPSTIKATRRIMNSSPPVTLNMNRAYRGPAMPSGPLRLRSPVLTAVVRRGRPGVAVAIGVVGRQVGQPTAAPRRRVPQLLEGGPQGAGASGQGIDAGQLGAQLGVVRGQRASGPADHDGNSHEDGG